VAPYDLLKSVVDVCNRLSIPYVTVGSMATIFYGEPRLTNDIDIVIDLSVEQVAEFCKAFPEPEYYLSRPAVETAVRSQRQFNIIQIKKGLKIDCILPSSPFDRAELSRGVLRQLTDDLQAVFAAPEDVILKKLEYYKLGESDKHLRDIAGVVKISGDLLDWEYLERMATQLGVAEQWQLLLARLNAP
jgi:hypothetical protein